MYPRRGIDIVFSPQQYQASDDLLPQLRLQFSVVRGQDTDKVLREVLGKSWVMVRDVGNEIYEVSKRDNSSSARRGWRLHEYVSLVRILGELVDEIPLV